MSIEAVVKEAKYFQAKKDKTTEEIASKGWKEMIIVLLERAFTEGYKAKECYEESLKKKGQPK